MNSIRPLTRNKNLYRNIKNRVSIRDLILPKVRYISSALCAGGLFSTIFAWNSPAEYMVISWSEIFFHNTMLAFLTGLTGKYIAAPFYILNAFFLGFGLIGSIKTAGLVCTLLLSAAHIIPEICAWMIFWTVAERMTIFYTNIHSDSVTNKMQSLITNCRIFIFGIFLLALAALAESLETFLFIS